MVKKLNKEKSIGKKVKNTVNKNFLLVTSLLLAAIIVSAGYSNAAVNVQAKKDDEARVRKMVERISRQNQKGIELGEFDNNRSSEPFVEPEKEALGGVKLSKYVKDFFGFKSATAAGCDMIVAPGYTDNKDKYTLIADTGTYRYDQNHTSWGNDRYGNISKCTNYGEAGCAPSAVAAAIRAFGNTSPPDVVGNYIADKSDSYRDNYTTSNPCKSGTNRTAISPAVSHFHEKETASQRSLETVFNTGKWTNIDEALKKGKPTIIRTENSCFTSSAHYMTIRGIVKRKSDGKMFYWISDSSSKNVQLAGQAELRESVTNAWTVQVNY